MKKLRTALSFLLAAMMLLACSSGVFAVPGKAEPQPAEPLKQPAGQDNVEPLTGETVVPEGHKGDVNFGDPIWEISLTEAAAGAGALHPVEIRAYSEWEVQRDADMGRYVAGAPIPAAAGTYTRRMYTETLTLDPDHTAPFIIFNAYVHIGEGQTFKVVCTDTATNETWEPDLGTIKNDQWQEYSFPITNNWSSYDYHNSYQVDITFVYSFTVSASKGGGEAPRCCVTNLDAFSLGDLSLALNVPDGLLHFTEADDNTNSNNVFDAYAYPNFARHYVKLRGEEDEDFVSGVTTHVVAAKGDVLTYEVFSQLDYMNGTTFFFGLGTSYEDMQVLEYGDESGNGSWRDWETFPFVNGR